MQESLAVLECLLPDYFTGAREMHEVTDLHMRDKHAAPEKQRKLSREATRIMEQRLSNEFILYDFIKRRLLQQYKHCQK